VPADNRSAIMAWQTALEGSFAAIFGNALVGILAQNVFGYNLGEAQADRSSLTNADNQSALGMALTLTVAMPWIICLILYTLLHCSYPHDLRRVKRLAAEREANAAAKHDQEIQ
ncbi:unnamed protein product, partial [Polarella glacialis]